ncbi:RNA polymerase sigma factor [Rossellomorea marisflavi]|uniref:RNA polymerase sigma factor n=1 Tax=Rossellomorea marisflavi TaxID=189381 RepID=UPI00064F3BC0|nr:RNA polymerase sigma factor [Rossellomorea marisflavi]KMK95165.1 DNA-directed RNA polymerase subunit sigma [Rossellomorea marisflavi]KML03250.1 DNA-directed RNA polymerase subunit sigma [Rossellomorea marisflavi]MCM2603324.1 RNA polymerase sigma factor [Rossellomorea marisflavi]
MTEFEKIYDQHFREVYAFILSMSRNEKLAEEITQETFFKALKAIDGFKGQCKMNVWLCQIAKNTYFTHLSKQKRLVPEEAVESSGDAVMEQLMENREEAMRVHKVLHSLQDPYKEVFTLRIFGELSFRDISGLFGKTESWARVTYHRARQKIQDRLKEEDR